MAGKNRFGAQKRRALVSPSSRTPKRRIFVPPSSPPLQDSSISSSPQLPPQKLFVTPYSQTGLQSSLLTSPLATSEGTEAILLGASNVIENLPNHQTEWEDEQDFSAQLSSDSESEKSDWSDNDSEELTDLSNKDSHQKAQSRQYHPWLDSVHTTRSKEKLIHVLRGEEMLPQNWWGMDRILAIFVHHRDDKWLNTAYCQFRRFAYYTMMIESRKDGCWPKALGRRELKSVLRTRLQPIAKAQYGKEVQKLCKTPGFGPTGDIRPGEIDRTPLESIVNVAKTTALMLTSLINSIGPLAKSSDIASHLANMKLVTILVTLCRSTHHNNSNYLPLLITLYLYSAGARVDAITLLNHLGLSVSYDTLQRKLKSIFFQSARWINMQASNPKLVGTWDNFEYRENVNGERVGDKLKFRSITMALWIQNGWRIPDSGLKQ
ncbi:hypothetical protein MMC31_002931 [Peltigera leucophlebia]|nr:hypothetical protein [Peltigera leucophlebia]